MILLIALAASPPIFSGDPEAGFRLEDPLRGALAATNAYGPWPEERWEVRLHEDPASFESATMAPRSRGAMWIGAVLHLRPWEQLRRRDLGAILRHELVHRRLGTAKLRRWEEEARCLHAETHVRPPIRWGTLPSPRLQDRLDRALARGTTQEQAWAYRALRAWLRKAPIPNPPIQEAPRGNAWRKEALALDERIVVRWPAERMPKELSVNGHKLSNEQGRSYRFSGEVHFGDDFPIRNLTGVVKATRTSRGWNLAWVTTPEAWVAAATAGEIGEDAPFEAKRALAAVLKRWLEGHPRGGHEDGSFCPLTHCAVVRGDASQGTRKAVATAPRLILDPSGAFFCGSKGGVSLSPREVWGGGSESAKNVESVPGDRWGTWARTFTAAQVGLLKRSVRSGLKPGQKGLMLGPSGPYPVEELRLAAGRAFGWTTWPSNACEADWKSDGSLELKGRGWGHNVGLCLATARWQAQQGLEAEAILAGTFGPEALK